SSHPRLRPKYASASSTRHSRHPFSSPVDCARCRAARDPAGPRTPHRMRQDGPVTGLFWPAEQALPRFAAPAALDVLDLCGASEAEALLATTAQGVVNRRRPRVWLLCDVDEGARTWLDTVGLPSEPVPGAEALVRRHRRDIRGAVLADPAVPATRNVATTLAGVEDAVVAEPAVAERLGLPVLADLRGRFADDRAAYRWAVDRLWPRTTRRM